MRGHIRTSSRGPSSAALAALVLTLTACASLGGGEPVDALPGGGDGGPGDGGSGSGDGASGGPGPEGPPLLQVESRGGFTLVGSDFSRVPLLTVYPDGTSISHGPIMEIWPPPALPNLLVQDLAADDVDALVAAARDAGLLADAPDYGQPGVADAPTTVVTLVVDGETYVHEVEALGVGDGTGTEPEVLPGEEPVEDMTGLDDDHRAARAALAGFLTEANELADTGNGEPYDIRAFAVMARPAEAGDETRDDGYERQVLPWPLDTSLADAATCVVVDGDDAATLEETLRGANAETLFEQDDARYDVWTRPLLPHEDSCDGLG
jgi:hypothetical protein